MARQPRFLVPELPQHVIQRGNNRATVFFTPGDYGFYRECLLDASRRYGCSVHAYVLMTNHVHLLISPSTEEALPQTMQSLGRRYAQYINWRRERTGTLWEGRYRAAVVDHESYFLACSRYIELNPVRAGMVARPCEYTGSSFAANADGTHDPLVTPHAIYEALGPTSDERCRAYRALFNSAIAEGTLEEIRDATQGGWPLGGSRFRAGVGQTCRLRPEPLPRGGVRVGAGRPPGRQRKLTGK